MKPFRSDELASRLSERDWEIIATLRSFKYLTTRQICRQHFGLALAWIHRENAGLKG